MMNRLTTHFSERIPVVKRRMTVHGPPELHSLTTLSFLVLFAPPPPQALDAVLYFS